MLLTTDLFRLLIISSYHAPLEGTKTNNYKSQICYKTTCISILTAVVTFVQHPYNDESILVTGCQLFILFIPRDHLHCTCKCCNHDVSDHFPMAGSTSLQRQTMWTMFHLVGAACYSHSIKTTSLATTEYNLPLCPSRV